MTSIEPTHVWVAPYAVREPRKVGDGSLTRATENGVHEVRCAQLEVLRAQMRSEQDGTVEGKTKAGGQGAVHELLGVLQQALSKQGKDDEDEG